jgi:hypothetical protein
MLLVMGDRLRGFDVSTGAEIYTSSNPMLKIQGAMAVSPIGSQVACFLLDGTLLAIPSPSP